MNDPFTLGINYWPRRKAMYWWGDFDPGEVREEFGVIKDIGMTVVRLFLLWDDFQPEPDSVNRTAIANLIQVADIAVENRLGLDVTFFTGHMSGPNWRPQRLRLGHALEGGLPGAGSNDRGLDGRHSRAIREVMYCTSVSRDW